MRRLVRAAKAGAWPGAEAADRLTLTFNDRQRRRIRLSTDGGSPVLLDLPQSITLADGDGLAFEDGGWLAVRAAQEDVLDVEAGDPRHLARLAWHLGNGHLPTELLADGRLRIAYDPRHRGDAGRPWRPLRAPRGTLPAGGGRLCARASA